MPGSRSPVDLPASLLSDPEMVRACRVRDFSAIFTLVRRRAGIYPSRIAALCDMTPSRVGEIIDGRRKLAHIDVIERVADGLRIPGALLGLAQRPWETPPSEALSGAPRLRLDEGEPAEHRAIGLDEILSLANPDRVTPSTLAAIQSSIELYWRHDDRHGGAALRPAIVGQFRHVSRLMSDTPESDLRHGLLSLGAELARLAGWAYFDARQYSAARSYFTQALTLGRETDDRQFIANVLSCLSLQATYEDNPRDAAALACAAQDSARGTPSSARVLSMLHMREAFAHATLRDPAACHQALAESHRHFDLAAQEDLAPNWVRYFDESKLTVDTGIALAQLGEAGKAERLITKGLHLEDTDQQRGRAFHTFWLAMTQLQQGSLDQACATAGIALDLAAGVDSPRVAAHVRDFHTHLRPFARASAVIAFEARMREAFP